jgi:hypothetical protein
MLLGAFRGGNPLERIVGIALLSEAALWFDAEVIIHGPLNPLLAAEIPFGCLHLKLATLPLEFSEALLGVHATFDGSMILFQNVVQILHGSVSTAVAQRPFLLTVRDRGAINRCQVGVDHSRLGMGSIAECLAKQALGSIGVAKC